MKKFYVIAGEASGDLHAGNMMRAMQQKDPTVDFRFWGGDHMQEVAGPPVKHIEELAFMGFIEVVSNLRTILGNISFCKKDILSYKPDALILIDYPGFNLRIAEWAHKNNIKVYYYISPQIWAWKQNRVHKIKKVVDELFVILPFEKAFYKKFDMDVTYVGHPLLDAIDQYQAQVTHEDLTKKHGLSDQPIIALLPGSRKQEISIKLPIMLESLKNYKAYQIVVAGAPNLAPSFYEQFMNDHLNVKIIHGATYDVLSLATAALVTSGTATLETALFKVPQVVCYKGSAVSYHIAKRLIKVAYISLVNLIMDKEVVRELIQSECNPVRIREELKQILPDGVRHTQLIEEYEILIKKLGGGGASERVAAQILSHN